MRVLTLFVIAAVYVAAWAVADWQRPVGGASTVVASGPVVRERADYPPRCDPSYPTICIPADSPDLDCTEIDYAGFKMSGDDPHGFDRDNDGVGCER